MPTLPNKIATTDKCLQNNNTHDAYLVLNNRMMVRTHIVCFERHEVVVSSLLHGVDLLALFKLFQGAHLTTILHHKFIPNKLINTTQGQYSFCLVH